MATVEPAQPLSVSVLGAGSWGTALAALIARHGHRTVLWGRDAQTLKPLLGDVPYIESAHPSPLSASRGFFGSRPFSRVNAVLAELGADPINWQLPPTESL